jgi:Flp pilus assembly protein TadD
LCLGTDRTPAAAALAPLVSADPTDCDAWAGLCATDATRAPDCLRTAIEHCPRDGRLWLQVAGRHAARGDRVKAAQAIATALATPHAPQIRPVAERLLRPAAPPP